MTDQTQKPPRKRKPRPQKSTPPAPPPASDFHFKGFTLDPFQVDAIKSIENGHSVIVAAPTGAGKTVIAEYAISRALELNRKIIYTAPIKALSNQKYRDFSTEYPGKIGIMTGDVILNPDAPVLIMTTEIFRNIIFDATDDRLADVESVIFDEIHYINDMQRGTVWEESIIFAPQNITFICLSATIPNFAEFADWMRSVRQKPIDTIVETHRPVPLRVTIWVPGHGFAELKDIKALEQKKDPADRRKLRKKQGSNVEIVKFLRNNDQFPCIYFHFSRVGCEEYAHHFRGARLLKSHERARALEIFETLAKQFDITTRTQTDIFRELLSDGVAYHHAGVLPAIKEIIERLYTLGLIKLLFTTETFAVGINMPARAVIFHNIMKNDGISFRYLTAREFQQMAGRAGRRGIDPVGYAYACVQPMDINYESIKHTISLNVENIESQFSLSYSSILNLLKTYGDGIYTVAEKSFNNYKNVSTIQTLKQRIAPQREEIARLKASPCRHNDYYNLITDLKRLNADLARFSKMLKLHGHHSDKKKDDLLSRIASTKEAIRGNTCTRCTRYKHCMSILRSINELEESSSTLSKEIVELENLQRDIIRRRLSLLQKLGYIDGNTLLPRGLIASQIFGYELVFTELYFAGYFQDLPPEGINVLISSIVFEARRGTTYRRISDHKIGATIQEATRHVDQLRSLESSFGVPPLVKLLDDRLNSAVLEWSRGIKFEELKRFTSGDDGDLVRSFRLIVDFIRQLKHAINDPTLNSKLDKCVSLLYRDVVDAEAQLSLSIDEGSQDDGAPDPAAGFRA